MPATAGPGPVSSSSPAPPIPLTTSPGIQARSPGCLILRRGWPGDVVTHAVKLVNRRFCMLTDCGPNLVPLPIDEGLLYDLVPSTPPIHKQLLPIQKPQELLDCGSEAPSAHGEVNLGQSWWRQPSSSIDPPELQRLGMQMHMRRRFAVRVSVVLNTEHRARLPAWIGPYPQSVCRVLNGKILRLVVQ